MCEYIEHPSTILLCGSPGKGKSYFIKHFIYHHCVEKEQSDFNHILCFTPTAHNGAYSFLPNEFVHERFDEQTLEDFLNIQARDKQPGLLILDDCIGSVRFNSKLFDKMFTTYRHLNLSILLSSQYPYKITPTLRECCSFGVIFQQDTHRSVSALYESMGQRFESCAMFKNYLEQNTTNKPHHYVLYNKNNEWSVDEGKQEEEKEERYYTVHKCSTFPDFLLKY